MRERERERIEQAGSFCGGIHGVALWFVKSKHSETRFQTKFGADYRNLFSQRVIVVHSVKHLLRLISLPD
jgi:hypothetical protein